MHPGISQLIQIYSLQMIPHISSCSQWPAHSSYRLSYSVVSILPPDVYSALMLCNIALIFSLIFINVFPDMDFQISFSLIFVYGKGIPSSRRVCPFLSSYFIHIQNFSLYNRNPMTSIRRSRRILSHISFY